MHKELELYLKKISFVADNKPIEYEAIYTSIKIEGCDFEIELNVKDKFAKMLLKNKLRKGELENV